MKLKFKADGKDVLIFIVFAIFLLYVVALAILNFPELALNGKFYGVNPFPAFDSAHLLQTLVFYILALAALFMSVSSYFFDREKGWGFSTEKTDKGYSRWAKEKEMKEELKLVHPKDENSPYAGIPIILKDEELWVDNGEYHNLVIGATGSGKTQTVIFPTVETLAKHGESMIITDPKGEIYEKTSNMLRARGYSILLLNFRDPQQGNAWNPLSLPYRVYQKGNQDKAIELLDDLALNILYEENSGNADPFWEKTSADYFSGLALGMFEDAPEDQVNINSISLMTTIGEEKFGGSTYIKEYFNSKDPTSAAAINASSTIMAPTETKGSILAVFKQKIKLFASRENLSEMLSHSDFDLETIGEKKTALFIVIQDEKKTYHSLVTILLKQCYETLIDVAQRHGGKLPVRTNFLLDEFANMPPLKDVTTMITAARSRLIRFTMIIQNFAQLNQVYGKENAETIKGNCGNIVYLISTELAALEEISKMCGEVKSKKDDKTASTPLVTVSDLQRMKQFETIILRIRKQPFKTKMTPYYKMDFGKQYPLATYPQREKQSVSVFDIREFVKEKKKAKLFEMMNEANSGGGALPNGGGMFPGGDGLPGGGLPTDFLPHDRPTLMGSGAPKKPAANDFNVDDIVKKIDAKIAEIEAEEKRQKESTAKVPSLPSAPSSRPTLMPSKETENPLPSVPKEKKEIEKPRKTIEELLNSIEVEPKKEPIEKSNKQEEKVVFPAKPIPQEKPKIHKENLPKDEVDISDDQFFDDFFDDED